MDKLSGKVAVVKGSVFRLWKAVSDLYLKEGEKVILTNSGFASTF